VLYDAFFKHQRKPKMTGLGELYYEGKEFEAQLEHLKPGVLSEDLRTALGMSDSSPPPWLVNMQRYGPPPSYPNLKVPGLNAPIPPGAQFGYQVRGRGTGGHRGAHTGAHTCLGHKVCGARFDKSSALPAQGGPQGQIVGPTGANSGAHRGTHSGPAAAAGMHVCCTVQSSKQTQTPTTSMILCVMLQIWMPCSLCRCPVSSVAATASLLTCYCCCIMPVLLLLQPGGWGKPPVDAQGNPLYGDVFGLAVDDEDSDAGMCGGGGPAAATGVGPSHQRGADTQGVDTGCTTRGWRGVSSKQWELDEVCSVQLGQQSVRTEVWCVQLGQSWRRRGVASPCYFYPGPAACVCC
jgi:hypothetical protein